MNDDREYWDEVESKTLARLEKNLEAAAIYTVGKVKEILSTPAPRKIVQAKKGMSVRRYVATTKAVWGFPPRKLSGELRRKQTYQISADKMTARIGSNVPYAGFLEKKDHPYLRIVLQRFWDRIQRIIVRGN